MSLGIKKEFLKQVILRDINSRFLFFFIGFSCINFCLGDLNIPQPFSGYAVVTQEYHILYSLSIYMQR
ncbi:hypothetical protein BpHYR1_027203 [Brachionus plicatilis]|uniref:Uncharacterized protein n=1 Tax=Brachionus plicatilis TaxID=10195 RepID=A0A3M7QRN8_BRAPC|nr:hypothetical protein BpHYR1_027203 [Brachionus plicatilis]